MVHRLRRELALQSEELEDATRKNACADVDREASKDLDGCKSCDEEFGARFVEDRSDLRSAGLVMVVLDQGAGVEEGPGNQKRSARSSSKMGFFAYPPEKVYSRPYPVVAAGAGGVGPR